jgi:hypothetical protein
MEFMIDRDSIKVYDVPGVGDIELPLSEIIEEISKKIGSYQVFDAALLVIKSTDYRESIQDIIAAKALMNFLVNFSPDRVFLVITHCDIYPDAVTEEYVAGKLESLKTFSGLDIPRDNVILLENTIETIKPLFDRLSYGEMKFLPKINWSSRVS